MKPSELRTLLEKGRGRAGYALEASEALNRCADLLIELWEAAKEHCDSSIFSGSVAEDEMTAILNLLEKS